MTPSQSVCDALRDHVVLASECIDRMYLNVYVPQLQRVGGVEWYLRGHLGQRFVSTTTVAPKTVVLAAGIAMSLPPENESLAEQENSSKEKNDDR